MTTRRYRTTEGRDDLGTLVHAELDDYGLDPYAFRVYAHLARRAGQHGVHWETVRNTAEICRMSPRRVHDALQLLVDQGLVTKQTYRGQASEYRLTPRREWRPPLTEAGATSAPGAEGSAPPAQGSAPGAEVGVHEVQRGSAPGADRSKPLKLVPDQELPPSPPTGGAARKRAGARSKFDPLEVELPNTVTPEAWAKFVASRTETGRPLTSVATAEILGGLVGEPQASEMLLTSARKGWRDVYPLDPPKTATGPPAPLPKPRPPATADAAWQALLANGALDAPTTVTLQALGRAGQDALGQIGWWERIRDALRLAKAGDEADLQEIELEFREAYAQALTGSEEAAA